MAPKCRFCKATASHQSIKGETVYGGQPDQHFWQCDSCQMIYLYPPLSEEEEKLFYKKEFEKFMTDRSGGDKDWSTPKKHFQSNQDEVKRRMSWLNPHLFEGMKVLEIGCSSGFMLDALRGKGVEVYGVDPSEVFIDFARSNSLAVYKNFEELIKEHDHAFDLILHYYVLEHIRNPVEFISRYMQCLCAEGKMICEVPNATDPLIELYRVPAFDRFYWSCAHHWYFNRESLSSVLNETGYRYQLFPEQRYDLSNHIVWLQDGKPGGMGRYTRIWGQNFEDLYKTKLKANWICDTLVAVVANHKGM